MLLKWLALAIIAWYVYRAGRNLVRAALGQPDEPLTGRGADPSRGRAEGEENNTVRVHAKQASPTSRPPDSQVEDARFEDV